MLMIDAFAEIYAKLLAGQHVKFYVLKDYFLLRDNRLCVTTPLQRKVLIESHAPPYAGHRGIEATIKGLEAFFYWPTMKKDAEAFVRDCLLCQKLKFDR